MTENSYEPLFNDNYNYEQHFVTKAEFANPQIKLGSDKDIKFLNVDECKNNAEFAEAMELLETADNLEVEDIDSEDMESDEMNASVPIKLGANVKCDSYVFQKFMNQCSNEEQNDNVDPFDDLRRELDEINVDQSQFTYKTEDIEQLELSPLEIQCMTECLKFKRKGIKFDSNLLQKTKQMAENMEDDDGCIDEADEIIDAWLVRKKTYVVKELLENYQKRIKEEANMKSSKNIPKMIAYDKPKKQRLEKQEKEIDSEEEEMLAREQEAINFKHKKRVLNETADEKKDRKREIKIAQRNKREIKKSRR